MRNVNFRRVGLYCTKRQIGKINAHGMSPSATEPLLRVSARSGHYPSRKNHPHLSPRWMNGKSGEMNSALLGRQKYGNYVQSYAKLSQAFFFKGGIFFQIGTLFHKVNFFSRAARYSPAHESWELVSLDELSLPGILQLWNQRFLVSNPSQRYVIARRDSTVAICAGFPSLRGAITPWQSKPAVRHCEAR